MQIKRIEFVKCQDVLTNSRIQRKSGTRLELKLQVVFNTALLVTEESVRLRFRTFYD